MIGLMRDARLRVSEAAELIWGDVERVGGLRSRVRRGSWRDQLPRGECRHDEAAVVKGGVKTYQRGVDARRLCPPKCQGKMSSE